MGENGKWGFLVPVTLAAATLLAASGANAGTPQSASSFEKPMDGAAQSPAKDDLILQPGNRSPEMRDHQSHSSHSSHSSHVSSR